MNSLANAALELLKAHRDALDHQRIAADQLRRVDTLVIGLARQHGLSWAQIAEALDTTPNALRMRYERGL